MNIYKKNKVYQRINDSIASILKYYLKKLLINLIKNKRFKQN